METLALPLVPDDLRQLVVDVLWPALLAHEIWICLQHANILLNPLCQRLDRNYGIALYENNMAWVISLTLSAYWAREILSMGLCFLVTPSPLTRTVVLISCGYHMFKITNVNIDAWRKWSPKLGIMRLLLDYWHFDTLVNCLISVKRMFLQGFDTGVHALVVRDLLYSSEAPSSSWFIFYVTTVVWIIHALAVQITRKSTATLMVEVYTRLSMLMGLVKPKSSKASLAVTDESDASKMLKKKEQTWVDFFCGPHFYVKPIGEKGCKVCRMLSKPNGAGISSNNYSTTIARAEAAHPGCNRGPDVVFLAHPLQLSSAFAWWLSPRSSGLQQDEAATAWRPSWWMETSLVTFFLGLFSALFLPLGNFLGKNAAFTVDRCTLEPFRCAQVCSVSRSESEEVSTPPAAGARRKKKVATSRKDDGADDSHTNAVGDVAKVPSIQQLAADIICEVWLTKVFAWQYVSQDPFGFWRSYARNVVIRSAKQAREQGCKVFGLGALNKAHFLNRGGEDVLQALLKDGPDVHADALLDNLEAGKSATATGGMCVVHGNTLTAAVVLEHIKRLLNMRKASPRSLSTSTDVILTGATSKIGRAIALKLAAMNVRTLCIGTDSTRMRDVLAECDAVSRSLAELSAPKKSKKRQVVLPQAAVVQFATIADASERAPDAIWVIGKYDSPKELLNTIPFGASVLSFSVPCPLRDMKGNLLRSDLQFVDAGMMIVPSSYEQQRQFSILLPRRLVYVCHAAAVVHCMEGWTHHEVGDVNPDDMQKTLDAAYKHGFMIDYSALTLPSDVEHGDGVYDAVVIGCGPSGLAAGAALKKEGVRNFTMLDQHADIEGQWRSQYEGLTLTTRGQHNALPFLPIPHHLFGRGHPDEVVKKSGRAPAWEKPIVKGEVTAEGYIRYLNTYARRMGLTQHIRFGYKVVKVARATGAIVNSGQQLQSPESECDRKPRLWEVHYEIVRRDNVSPSTGTSTIASTCTHDGSRRGTSTPVGGDEYVCKGVFLCKNVVVASGKASIPWSEEELLKKLKDFKGRVVNAKDVNNSQEIAAEGTVLIVGAGNSALDLSDAILRAKRALGKETLPMLHLSMRSIPPVVPRQWMCLSIEWLSARLFKYSPQYAVDTVALVFYRFLHASSSYTDKLPNRRRNPDWLPRASRRVPPIDKYGFVQAVSSGIISVHSTVERVEGSRIFFKAAGTSSSCGMTDGSDYLDVDVIVLCTGYEADFSWLEVESEREYQLQKSRSRYLAEMAKSRSKQPSIASKDGLFFVGYDPGDALIPIMGIREQAVSVASLISANI